MLDWLKPGQEVICIDAANTNSSGVADLVEGAHYVIEAVYDMESIIQIMKQNQYTSMRPAFGVHLVGVSRRDATAFRMPFHYQRFRPVIKRTTDISSLEALLKTTKIKAPELV
jgi:hypothetical protein